MNCEYRVIRRKIFFSNGTPTYHYYISTAYVGNDDNVVSILDGYGNPEGMTIQGLQACYIEFAEAFTKPIIDYDSVPIKSIELSDEEFEEETEDDMLVLDDEDFWAGEEEKRKVEEVLYNNKYVDKDLSDVFDMLINENDLLYDEDDDDLFDHSDIFDDDEDD